ncbi:SDR family oxidoreductase [Nonomuraea sp. NPDC050310]|uniref:SDR family NAD(P)-dependent oxidoreductase n=1 Tax=unclassified Nonomuraea TaxID=2593643 RepID=UPI0033ED6573
MTDRRLAEQVALVVGAGRGIGRAMALALAGAGAKVLVTARTRDEVEETAEFARGVALVGDAADPGHARAAVGRAIRLHGRLDLLVCAAGRLGAVGPLSLTDPAQWWRDVEVNLRSAMQFTREALPYMTERGQGRVVYLAGGGGPYLTAYGVAKQGLSFLARSVDEEVGKSGVRVFELFPGTVDTRLGRRFAESEEAKLWLPGLVASVTARRAGPEAAATAVVRLAAGELDHLAGGLVRADALDEG